MNKEENKNVQLEGIKDYFENSIKWVPTLIESCPKSMKKFSEPGATKNKHGLSGRTTVSQGDIERMINSKIELLLLPGPNYSKLTHFEELVDGMILAIKSLRIFPDRKSLSKFNNRVSVLKELIMNHWSYFGRKSIYYIMLAVLLFLSKQFMLSPSQVCYICKELGVKAPPIRLPPQVIKTFKHIRYVLKWKKSNSSEATQ